MSVSKQMQPPERSQVCTFPEYPMTKLTRRTALTGAATAAAALALPGEAAHAQAKGRIVVGTWGGDYARLLDKNIDQPLLIKQGWEIAQDQAGDSQRRSKILAEQRLPRGTSDVQGLSAINMFQMHDAGTVLPIDYSRLKNAGNHPLDEVSLGHRPHLLGQGRRLRAENVSDRAEELQGHFRPQEWQ
jgi:hypothetical protein